METKHTKGPWRTGEELPCKNKLGAPTEFWWDILAPNAFGQGAAPLKIATVCAHNDIKMIDPQIKANARLIAAAPALLEACKNIVAWLNDVGKTNKSRRGRVPSRLLDAIETAIALAEKGE